MLPLPESGLDDPALDDFVRLTDVALRRRLEPAGGLYLAESTKVIGRALAAGHVPTYLVKRGDRLEQALSTPRLAARGYLP